MAGGAELRPLLESLRPRKRRQHHRCKDGDERQQSLLGIFGHVPAASQ